MDTYKIVLALHVISIATWMLMLVYLPKLFVYHINTPSHSQSVIALQEKNLYNVGTVAMLLSITFGLILLYLNPHLLKSGGWIHLKFTLVAFIVVYHFICKRFMTRLVKDTTNQSLLFFRVFRIIPEIITSIIILLTIIKPF